MNFIDVARIVWKMLRKTYPEQIIFFVTSRCNFSCKMCFNPPETSGDELTLAEYEKISRTIPAFHWMMISGGEPFLRNDIAEICRLFVRNNRVRKINLPTNAYFTERIIPLTEEILRIHGGCFLNLGLSLHAVGEKHDEITGVPGSFDHVMETYHALQALRARYPNLGIAVPVIHCGYNEQDIRELLAFIFREMDVDDICINLVRGTPRLERASAVSAEQYEANCRFLQGLIYRHRDYYFNLPFRGFYVSKDLVLRDIIWSTLRTRAFQIPCYAGRISAVIDERGDVYPCELRHQKFGNLRESDYNFSEIWKSGERRRVLSGIKTSRCFCTHECSNTTNILFNPRLYGRLIATWIRLHREGWGRRAPGEKGEGG